jgi:hypothetical protein
MAANDQFVSSKQIMQKHSYMFYHLALDPFVSNHTQILLLWIVSAKSKQRSIHRSYLTGSQKLQ